MVGLRTQENVKFTAFFRVVQKAADSMGKVFFPDCGEGNQFEDETIECEDLSGRLVDRKDAEEFEKVFASNEEIPEKWDDFGTFVSWESNGGQIRILFYESTLH